MTVTNIKKATFKHIESELYTYKDTLKEIRKLRQEIINPYDDDVDENVGSNGTSDPGRPTERVATRLLTHRTLRNLEEIIVAIDYAYDLVSEDHRKVIRTKYWSGKRLNWYDVSVQLNMHRNTAMKLRKEVILLIADKIGWR
ncbi:hypothetical protein [Salimicrobium album]|uniref:Phage transcriptional activator, RinA family n=1 Tax=Salimicrobium album TaxID=50717 RepID=A0A1H3DEA4_9BACI|nr:hypothetical protein [Salimicrobium album]SDX64726.1 phage transcriptional activator, RinA family [Salimicrobium album]